MMTTNLIIEGKVFHKETSSSTVVVPVALQAVARSSKDLDKTLILVS